MPIHALPITRGGAESLCDGGLLALYFCCARQGDSALEAGVSSLPSGSRGWSWTTQPREEGQGQPGQEHKIHMLPVFRLPEVSKNPAGGFLRRLPREETRLERECRVREAEEIDKMKTALGLTDRELEALEEELLPGKGVAAVSSRLANPDCSDNQDLERDPQDVLYGPDSALGRQQQHQQPHEARSVSLGGKRRRRGGGGRRTAHDLSPPRDKTTHAVVDIPTPRVLRRSPHSSLGAELAASAALSVRFTGKGTKTGAWTSAGEIGLGVPSGSILGTTVKTEQLVAAAADVGMVNLLELRRELGRSVGQVGRPESRTFCRQDTCEQGTLDTKVSIS